MIVCVIVCVIACAKNSTVAVEHRCVLRDCKNLFAEEEERSIERQGQRDGKSEGHGLIDSSREEAWIDPQQQGEERCREREIDLEGEHALEPNGKRVVPLLAVATSAQLQPSCTSCS